MAIKYVNIRNLLVDRVCSALSCMRVQIVEVDLTTEGKTKLEVGMTLSFTYQVLSHIYRTYTT